MKILNSHLQITYQCINNNTKNREYSNIPFCANIVNNTKAPVTKFFLLSKIYNNIKSVFKKEPLFHNDTEKFIYIMDKLIKKAEPIMIKARKAGWYFNINSTNTARILMELAQLRFYALCRNKSYNKLLDIDKTQLPEQEAKQLKFILKEFEDGLNNSAAIKEIHTKKSKIAQKYYTYTPMIDGEKVTNNYIIHILQNKTDSKLREKAYDAYIKIGDLIADDLKELVKMRNEYAKTKGYNNYFDFVLKEDFDVKPEILYNLIDEVYSKALPKIKFIQTKKEKELKEFFGIDNLNSHHYHIILESSPEKAINDILKNCNIEDIAKKMYSMMGYDLDSFQKEGKLTLDLYPRKNKSKQACCFGIDNGKDVRIIANLTNNIQSLYTLTHELGHAVYSLGIPSALNFLERKPASSAASEAIAMMMESIIHKENLLKDIIPNDILLKYQESLKENEALFVLHSKRIIEFERELYTNPEQNPAKIWAKLRKQYFNIDEEPNNEWATVLHYITHPGYYQNYFRAMLMKEQIYNHLHKVLGNITENKKTAEYLNKNVFAKGASVNEYDLIKQLTGKEFSKEDFIAELQLSRHN